MTAEHHRHVAFTGPLSRFVEEEVTQRRCASASEVVRDALRLLIEPREANYQLASEDS